MMETIHNSTVHACAKFKIPSCMVQIQPPVLTVTTIMSLVGNTEISVP